MFCGVHVDTIFMNASGCRCSTAEQLFELDQNPHIGIVVTKTATLHPRNTNGSFYDAQESVNNIGLRNPGFMYYVHLRARVKKPMMISIYATSTAELIDMLDTIHSLCHYPTFVEWNISCPNIQNMADHWDMLLSIQKHIPTWTHLIIGLKLRWSLKIASLVTKLTQSNIRFITCSNTLPNALVLTSTNHIIRGGLSGVKSLALANVYDLHQQLHETKIEIIGCGGIRTKKDVQDYLFCGAKMVQVGTEFLRNKRIFSKL